VAARNKPVAHPEFYADEPGAGAVGAVGAHEAKSPGCIEDAKNGVLKGWIARPLGSEFDVYADGLLIGPVPLTNTSANVVGPALEFPRERFAFLLPTALLDGDPHEFEIRPAHQKRRPARPLVRTLSAPLFTDAPKAPKGWIDGIRDGVLYGWYAAPTGSQLIVSVDDSYLGNTRNNIPRDDVIAAGAASEPVGFEIDLPDRLKDGGEHVIEVRAAAADVATEALISSLVIAKDATARTDRKRRTRAAVVCWDLGHNPAGRALVLVQALERLYDEVHLIGPLFERFGSRVWEPIVDNRGIRIVTERVKNFADLRAFRQKILLQKYDFVHMCKSRWPTLYLGIPLAQASECKMALDIDDYELGFFENSDNSTLPAGVIEKLSRDELLPFDGEATLLAHSLIEKFPALTVSNIALQRKFGGTIIRHARNEVEFDPTIYNRAHIRSSYGYGVTDKVILFLGTIRRHKGILRLARAIAELNRPDLKLCLIGPIGEPTLEKEIRDVLGARVCFHRGVPFTALAGTTLLADLVCLPQELKSEISQYQMPAKLTDALSMGIPVIVENLPPFRDLINVPGIYVRRSESLAAIITRALTADPAQRSRVRSLFLTEFSTTAAADRLGKLIRALPSADHQKLARDAQKIGISADAEAPAGNAVRAFIPKFIGRDVVFLWKQNDSNLFGRRSDMVIRQLVKQGFAGRVLQFDAAMSLDNVVRLQERAGQNPLSADGMVFRNVASRHLGLAHELQVSRFTIIHDNKKRSFLGRTLPAETDVPELLRAIFRAERVSEEALLWTCPVAFDLDWFNAARDFPFKVVDLIDDQRSFASTESYRRKLSEHYALAMASADLVFANCSGVAERFRGLTRKEIHVISNGAEKLARKDVQAIDIFAGRKDILRIGYVGNLRERIDVELLSKIAECNPSWRLILVGPTGGQTAIEDLGRYSNITLLGPQRYEDSIRIAASFDVAIIPHVINELTDSMNPLKMYMYQMLGLPVISTEVANMTGANGLLQVARSHEEFLTYLVNFGTRSTRERGTRRRAGANASNVYWEDNVANMIGILCQSLRL
jgi:glycosyltransferase involved in cell wall biosynthesis